MNMNETKRKRGRPLADKTKPSLSAEKLHLSAQKVYNLSEMTRLLHRSKSLLCIHIKEGLLRATRPYEGAMWFVKEEDVRAYISERMPGATLEALIEAIDKQAKPQMIRKPRS